MLQNCDANNAKQCKTQSGCEDSGHNWVPGAAGDVCAANVCGDAIIKGNEQCEPGLGISTATCASQGFDSGNLACGVDCKFDTTACVSDQGGACVTDGMEEADKSLLEQIAAVLNSGDSAISKVAQIAGILTALF